MTLLVNTPPCLEARPLEAWDDDRDLQRRRVRRRAGAVIAVAGLVNLASALTPPVRGRLELLIAVVPVTVPQAASAAVAALGIALLLLSRGVRRGQRHAWSLAVLVLGVTTMLHVVKGLDVEEAAASLVALAYLVHGRRSFAGRADRPALGRALTAVLAGAVAAVSVGTITALYVPRPTHMPVATAIAAVGERLVGFDTIAIPARRDHFLTAGLGGVGFALFVFAGWAVFRPVADRLRSGNDGCDRARAIVDRYGGDTLAYFALRADKQHWIGGDTLVAYAVHNGVCLVSPDPIGPPHERAAAWRAFRAHADQHGWSIAVMAASADWLPTYEASGMSSLYIGDEAVVADCGTFTLEGGRNKGLRQAVNRIAKYGYTIEFHDPAQIDPGLVAELRALMGESRRGEFERGFSMTLGRVFSPEDSGLLLAVCRDPAGEPAAFCQFVPADDISGYSLDLMRRSESDDHPNGLTDFVVVRTIEHVASQGGRGLALNFAVMRSVMAGDESTGPTNRLQRRVLGWLSESMQIESLWRYNAKFHPEWRPRYAVYDSLPSFLPSAFAVAKAESFCELPVIGRLFTPAA